MNLRLPTQQFSYLPHRNVEDTAEHCTFWAGYNVRFNKLMSKAEREGGFQVIPLWQSKLFEGIHAWYQEVVTSNR